MPPWMMFLGPLLGTFIDSARHDALQDKELGFKREEQEKFENWANNLSAESIFGDTTMSRLGNMFNFGGRGMGGRQYAAPGSTDIKDEFKWGGDTMSETFGKVAGDLDFRYDKSNYLNDLTGVTDRVRSGVGDIAQALSQSGTKLRTDLSDARIQGYRESELGQLEDVRRQQAGQLNQEIGGFLGQGGNLEAGQQAFRAAQRDQGRQALRAGQDIERGAQQMLNQRDLEKATLQAQLDTATAQMRNQRRIAGAGLEADALARAGVIDAGGLQFGENMTQQGLRDQMAYGINQANLTGADRTAALAENQAAWTTFMNMLNMENQASFMIPALQLQAMTQGSAPIQGWQPSFVPFAPAINQGINAVIADKAATPKGGQSFGGGFMGFSANYGESCIDGNCRVETPTGDKHLKDVKVDDIVFDVDGNPQLVVAKDYGYDKNEPDMILLTTDETFQICGTEDHVVGGKKLGEYEAGDEIAMATHETTVMSAMKVPYRKSGDLLLENGKPYVVEGFVVETAGMKDQINEIGLDEWHKRVDELGQARETD